MEPESLNDTEPLWTALDVAHYLKISRSSVYGLAERGALPVVRIGALLRFPPAAIRALGNTARPAPVVHLKARPPDKTSGPG